MLTTATPAWAAPVSETPVAGSWGPYKSCPNKPESVNCASVYTIVSIGDRTYLAGNFTHIVSPDRKTKQLANNLVAVNASGQPDMTFTRHTFDGPIRAMTTDGSRLYVGGSFKRVDGAYQNKVAAFSPAGQLQAFKPATASPVRALAISNGSLYVGSTTVRKVSTATGAADESFAFPAITSDSVNPAYVWSLLVHSGRLYAGGHWATIGGLAQHSVAAVNPSTGALDTTFKPVVESFFPQDELLGIADMAPGPDAGIFAAQEGHSNRAYRFGPNGGRIWKKGMDGDAQTIEVDGDTVYVGGHFTCWSGCQTATPILRNHIAAVTASKGALLAWDPGMGASYSPYFYGVWVARILNGSLWTGGVFNSVTTDGVTYPARKVAIFRP